MGTDRLKPLSIEETSRRLPLVRSIVSGIVDTWRELLQIADIPPSPILKPGGDSFFVSTTALAIVRNEAQEDFQWLTKRMEEGRQELWELSAILRDHREGSVDFPSLLRGRPIFLSWRLGESRVAHWHEPDEDFRRRHPVDPVMDELLTLWDPDELGEDGE